MNLKDARQTLFPRDRMAPPHGIDTKDAIAVAAHANAVFAEFGWQSSAALLERVFADVTKMFEGNWPGYRAIDMRYHNYEHTLQATVCIVDILHGRQRTGDEPRFRQRDAELCVIAAILHDSGYLKRDDDLTGTGAKYTRVHVERSCDFSRGYLPSLGFSPSEIEDVCTAIGSTGPNVQIADQPFRRPLAHLMACMLVTADYLSQLSASDYIEKLDYLYAEFLESWDFEATPEADRLFKSADDLKQKTPAFWSKLVCPMLDADAQGMHRYLSLTGQPNHYLQAVEANIAEIRRRTQT